MALIEIWFPCQANRDKRSERIVSHDKRVFRLLLLYSAWQGSGREKENECQPGSHGQDIISFSSCKPLPDSTWDSLAKQFGFAVSDSQGWGSGWQVNRDRFSIHYARTITIPSPAAANRRCHGLEKIGLSCPGVIMITSRTHLRLTH